MRQLFTIAAVLSAMPLMAQTHILNGCVSTDGVERTDWIYNDLNKVIEIRASDETYPEWNSIRRVIWDENGFQTGERLYQDIDVSGTGDYNDYRWNGILEFKYDDRNLIVERLVYNNAAPRGVKEPDFQFAGIITYDYDRKGRMTAASTYFDKEKTSLYQKIEYTYDDSGYLREALTYMTNWSTGGMTVSNRETYTYLADGRISRISKDVADVDTGDLYCSGGTVYRYGDDGRLLAKEMQNTSGSVLSKYEFNYDGTPVSAADVIFPYNEDDLDDNELWRQLDRMPVSYDDYATDSNTGILTKVATYEYVLGSLSGVCDAFSEDVRRGPVVLSFFDGTLVLGGVEPGTALGVFSADGRRVADARYARGGVVLSGLPAGAYIVSTPAGAVKVWK